jgi:hypothetical protein
MEIDTAFMLFCLYVCRIEIQIILLLCNGGHSQGSEINSQTQSFDAYRNSFLRVISVIIEIINYPFKLGEMRFNRPFSFQFPDPTSIFSARCAR